MTPLRSASALRWVLVSLFLCLVTTACASGPSDSSKRDAAVESGVWYPQRHPETAFHEHDDEQGGLIVLPGESKVKVLNPVAIRVFSLIDGTRTPEDVARAVFDEFEIDYVAALADVYVFLGELEEEGLLAHPIPDRLREKCGLEPRPTVVEAH